MNCDEMERLLDAGLFEDDSEALKKAHQHAATCNNCAERYGNILQSGNILKAIRHTTPRMTDRDAEALTNKVMEVISSPDQSAVKQKTREIHGSGIRIFIRLLAAASIVLFMVFGAEQYFVLEKLSRLESQMDLAQQSKPVHVNFRSLLPGKELNGRENENLSHFLMEVRDDLFRQSLLKYRFKQVSTIYLTQFAGNLSEQQLEQLKQSFKPE